MEKLIDNNDFKLPSDLPEGFFDVVSKVLDFIDDVDKIKNKQI